MPNLFLSRIVVFFRSFAFYMSILFAISSKSEPIATEIVDFERLSLLEKQGFSFSKIVFNKGDLASNADLYEEGPNHSKQYQSFAYDLQKELDLIEKNHILGNSLGKD